MSSSCQLFLKSGRPDQRHFHRERHHEQQRPADQGEDGETPPSRFGGTAQYVPTLTASNHQLWCSSARLEVGGSVDRGKLLQLHACSTDAVPPAYHVPHCFSRAGAHVPLQGPLRYSRHSLRLGLRVLPRLMC